jgi:hypothetical protein
VRRGARRPGTLIVDPPGRRPDAHEVVLALSGWDVAEFTLSEVGRYMFHPHQHSIAHRGAMGWFSAT